MSGRYQWTDEATEALLSLWKKKGHERRRPDYDDITNCMNEMGFKVSKKHCRYRMKNLMYRYKKAASKARMDGREIKHRHFKKLGIMMGHSEEAIPPSLYHEGDGEEDEEEEEEDNEEEEIEEEDSEVNFTEAQPHVVYISRTDQDLSTGRNSNEAGGCSELYQTKGTTSTPLLSGEPETLHSGLVLPSSRSCRGSSEDAMAAEVGQAGRSADGVQQRAQLETSTQQPMDRHFLNFMALLQEKAEAREDARQRRLMEHEKRMEEKRQKWRQKELRHQETLSHMVLQGMERLGQLFIFAQQQQPLDSEQQGASRSHQPSTSEGELGESSGEQSETLIKLSDTLEDDGRTLEGTQKIVQDEHTDSLKEMHETLT